MKMSPFRVCAFAVLIFLSTASFAEYYLVYGTQPCCVIKKHHAVARKHIVVKKIHHRQVVHHHYHQRFYSPRMEVYYVKPAASCCTCHEVWIQGRWDCYGGGGCGRSSAYDSDGYSYATTKITYNPDLTTGDDDTWVDPNMNING